jgi:hypothetical protein
MKLSPAELDLLYRQASAAIDGTIEAAEMDQLQLLLSHSEAAREFFAEYMYLQATLIRSLRDVGGATDAPTAKAAEPVAATASLPAVAPASHLGFLGRSVNSLGRPVVGVTLAASVLFATYVAVLFWGMLDKEARGLRLEALRAQANGGENNESSSLSPVATITNTRDAEWSAPAGNSAFERQKSKIDQGESLRLASGVVELKLRQGVKLAIEGPAEWTIDGNNNATLKRGKLVATVPRQAIGFTLETPTAKIVDLGTEFGVHVAAAGETSLQVLKGEVEFARNNGNAQQQRVTAGEGRRIRVATPGGVPVIEKIPFDATPIATRSPSTIPFDHWREASQKLRTDPSLVAYYDFESQGTQLRNVVADKLHGEIITARAKAPSTQGRWYGKHALAFGKDFASVSIPDDSALRPKGDLTFGAWFRADALPAPGTFAPLLVKGIYPKRNYSLWIQPDGVLNLDANNDAGAQFYCLSNKPIVIGAWNFAVGMFDSGKLRLFLNGAEVSAPRPLAADIVMDDEPILLGRSRETNMPHLLNGVIDELAIYSRALSVEEIAEMYRTGKPDR